MPSTSQAQARFFRWASHNKGRARKEGVLPKMSDSAMRDFASTPDAGLPEHADSGATPMQRRYKVWVGHGGPDREIFPAGHTLGDVTHEFAKTTDEHMDKGGWISRVTSSPNFKRGALTAQAKKVGETPMQFARQHEHDSGVTGRRARFAVNASG